MKISHLAILVSFPVIHNVNSFLITNPKEQIVSYHRKSLKLHKSIFITIPTFHYRNLLTIHNNHHHHQPSRPRHRHDRTKKKNTAVYYSSSSEEKNQNTEMNTQSLISLSNQRDYGYRKSTSGGRLATAISSGRQHTKHNKNNRNRVQKNKKHMNRNVEKSKLLKAIQLEQRLQASIDNLRSNVDVTNIRERNKNYEQTPAPLILFPTTRECNTAMAVFGDNNEFLRALRLFVKMRKSVYIAKKQQQNGSNGSNNKLNKVFVLPPAPTLVTYSTLMSRAVQLGKPQVALRLWHLMTIQSNYFSSSSTMVASTSTSPTVQKMFTTQSPIIPDVRAVNILMNAYAKLADVDSCKMILSQMLNSDNDDANTELKDGSSKMNTNKNDDADDTNQYMIPIPPMKPNIVTWNTIIDACQRAGELEQALQLRQNMEIIGGIQPDVRTYTSLISAVARKGSAYYGARDPDMGFSLLEEMMERGLRPNGMTYCALIDVCRRCDRSDLALKVLRMMLRQNTKSPGRKIENEVGAWTAAIDACGKAGRMDTAMRLFRSMCSPNFVYVKPNMVTCGSIMNCLFKEKKLNMDHIFEVLQYMKHEGLEPTEVMYTSLISSAGTLVKAENHEMVNQSQHSGKKSGTTSAVDIYTELMGTLMQSNENTSAKSKENVSLDRTNISNSNEPLLLKVFLVYQEMKTAGAEADLALYNALMKACARAGDIRRAQSVMSSIYQQSLQPTSVTWREMLRAASNSNNGELVEDLWQKAWKNLDIETDNIGNRISIVDQANYADEKWVPNVDAFDYLVSGYLRQASLVGTKEKTKVILYQKIISMYKRVLKMNETDEIDEEWGLHHVDLEYLHTSQRTMMVVLRATVVMELLKQKRKMNEGILLESISPERKIAISIAKLDCLSDKRAIAAASDTKNMKALELARIWSHAP